MGTFDTDPGNAGATCLRAQQGVVVWDHRRPAPVYGKSL